MVTKQMTTEFQQLLKQPNLKAIERELKSLGVQMGVTIRLKKDGEINLTNFAHQQILKKLVQQTRNIPVKAAVKKTKKRATLDDVNADTIKQTTEQLSDSDDNIAITVHIPVDSFITKLLSRLKTA